LDLWLAARRFDDAGQTRIEDSSGPASVQDKRIRQHGTSIAAELLRSATVALRQRAETIEPRIPAQVLADDGGVGGFHNRSQVSTKLLRLPSVGGRSGDGRTSARASRPSGYVAPSPASGVRRPCWTRSGPHFG